MAMKAKVGAGIARIGKTIQYAQTKAKLPDVSQAAGAQVQEVDKPSQDPNMSVPELLNPVGEKLKTTKATALELPLATWTHIQEASSNVNISEALGVAGKYIQENPVTFALQVVGVTTTVGSILTVPILGAVGFAATGPVAGSAAATWQGAIGLVQAGSTFAWCQSATMGGAAVGGIIATGAAGAGVAGAATASQLPRVRKRLWGLFGKDVDRPGL